MSPETLVFLVTDHPPKSLKFSYVGHSQERYERRGWPYSESCWSSITKTFSGSVFRLSGLGDGSTYSHLYHRCTESLLHVPFLPEAFNTKAKDLKFGKEEDRAVVMKLYRESFETYFVHVRELNYENLRWEEEDAQKLLDLMNQDKTRELQALNVSRNHLTARFCDSFRRVVHKTCLCELDLSHNPVNDNGVALLSDVLVGLRKVSLRNVGLTQHGCRLLRSRLSASKSKSKTTYLDMGENLIGDDGVTIVGELFHKLAYLGLRNTACSDAGCKGLATSMKSEQISVLDLRANQIGTCGALVSLVQRRPSIKLLKLTGNQTREHSREMLQLMCAAQGVKLEA